MPKYAMVIDLHRCVGCAECAIACKEENNVDTGIFWANYQQKTEGTFPNVRFTYVPTLCNHCENAACVRVCPTKAMHKDENGVTLHDPKKCIGCKSCMQACPYGVISYNRINPHAAWDDSKATVQDCTASGREIQEKLKCKPPYYNKDRAATYEGVREQGIVEKCTFCDHRIKDGLEPFCVASCPARARNFGDLDDPDSEVSRLLKKYDGQVLKQEKGTRPKVYYIRRYSGG